MAGLFIGCNDSTARSRRHWYRGNLHTHTLWSDGNDYPEVVIAWYKQHGYDFLAISDHNTLQNTRKWITVDSSGYDQFARYSRLFGDRWVTVEPVIDTLSGGDAEKWRVRLKTMSEYRPLFEEPGKFLLIRSEEITDRFEKKPIHVNATNIQKLIPPRHGNSVVEVLQNDVDAVLAQSKATGEPILPHINHPNYGYAITPQALARVHGDNFFEVYNGHPAVHNGGDSTHSSSDALWDDVLTQRLIHNNEMLYGLAVDDAHHYTQFDSFHANPGRGWVMVHATELAPNAIISALEEGAFYASSGVVLDSIWSDSHQLAFKIHGNPGVEYTTRFIGTLANDTDRTGIVIATSQNLMPEFQFRGNELYIRAKIISSKPKANPGVPGEVECAWVQPVQVQPYP